MNNIDKATMYQAIEKHGANLNAIFNTPFDNITLCKKLLRLENKLHRLAEQYCNGDIDEETYDLAETPIAKKVADILCVKTADGVPVYPLYFNRDPRGYSLKLDDDFCRDKQIYKDWGGYGILAPDFSID